jgi:hypothetical protein
VCERERESERERERERERGRERVHAYVYTNIHLHIHIHTYTYTYTYMRIYDYAHLAYIHTRTHTDTDTHTHTHTYDDGHLAGMVTVALPSLLVKSNSMKTLSGLNLMYKTYVPAGTSSVMSIHEQSRDQPRCEEKNLRSQHPNALLMYHRECFFFSERMPVSKVLSIVRSDFLFYRSYI